MRFSLTLNLILLTTVAQCSIASASVVSTFQLDSNPQSSQSSLQFINSLSDGGVTFDAILTVSGFGSTGDPQAGNAGNPINIGNNSNGVGVGSGSSTIADDESLLLQFSFDNVLGGSVVLSSFLQVELSGFESGENSRIFDSFNGNLLVDVDGPATVVTLPGDTQSLVVFGENGTETTSFRLASVSASFEGTASAVPEPSTLAGLVVGLIAFVAQKARKRSSCDNSIFRTSV